MDNSDHDIEIVEQYDNAPIEEIPMPKTSKGKDFKRRPTAKQLETMRKNLEKGRAKRALKAKKEKEEYDEYVVKSPKIKQRRSRKYVQSEPEEEYYYEDESVTDGSDSDVEYEIKPKRKSDKKQPKPTKKEIKEKAKIDRIEDILYELVSIQKNAKKSKPQVVRNTVIQVPKAVSSNKTDGSLGKLLKLF